MIFNTSVEVKNRLIKENEGNFASLTRNFQIYTKCQEGKNYSSIRVRNNNLGKKWFLKIRKFL